MSNRYVSRLLNFCATLLTRENIGWPYVNDSRRVVMDFRFIQIGLAHSNLLEGVRNARATIDFVSLHNNDKSDKYPHLLYE